MIIEVCPFFEEVDVLQARIDLMAGCTRLIVIEGDRTFQGAPKPYHLDAVTLPASVTRHRVHLPAVAGPWEREQHQRDMRRPGWVRPDALVVCCDIDEFVDPAALPEIHAAVRQHTAVTVEMANIIFGYRQNLRPWHHPKAFLAENWPPSIHHLRNGPALPVVASAGWHLSWLGDLARKRRKVEAFSHTECGPGSEMWHWVSAGVTDPNGEPHVDADLDALPGPLQSLIRSTNPGGSSRRLRAMAVDVDSE